jgi:hypothetical protein
VLGRLRRRRLEIEVLKEVCFMVLHGVDHEWMTGMEIR